MAITPEQRAKLDALSGRSSAAPQNTLPASVRLSPEQRAKLDALAGRQANLPQAPAEPGFLSRMGANLRRRAGEAYNTLGEAARGEINPVETGIRVVGQGLASVGDVIGEGLTSGYRTFVPESVKPVIEKGAQVGLEALGVPMAMEKYGQFAEAHPRAAKNIEGIANIAFNLPSAAGVKIAGEAAETVAKQGVKKASLKAAKVASEAVESAGKKALSSLEEQYSSIVRLAKKGKQAEAEWGKNTAKLLAEEGGVDLGVLPDKTLDTYSSAVPQVKERLQEASTAVKRVIADSGKFGNIDQAERLALEANESTKKLGSVYEKNREQIKNEFAALRKNYEGLAIQAENGEMLLPLAVIDDAKSGAWDRAFSGAPLSTTKASQDTDFLIGKSLQQTVEDGIDDAGIKAMNKKVGDYAEALDVLRNAHGMVLPGGRIGKYTAQAIGAGIGSVAGGPFGGLVGFLGADKVADILSNPSIRTGYLRRILEKAGATKNQSKQLAEEAAEIIRKRQTERATKKLLPAPKQTKTMPTLPLK